MILSDEQIKQISNSIVFDVRQYIKEHQEEYEKFIAEETANQTKQNSTKGDKRNGTK